MSSSAPDSQAEYYFLMLALFSFVDGNRSGASHAPQTISKPIEELRRSMQAVESGNFDINITVHTSNEVYSWRKTATSPLRRSVTSSSRTARSRS